uniref:Uncharacterized protein n=1 Tax=Arundo donax TaxID=35708 RepID=A0A0A9FUU7_ARUDO
MISFCSQVSILDFNNSSRSLPLFLESLSMSSTSFILCLNASFACKALLSSC